MADEITEINWELIEQVRILLRKNGWKQRDLYFAFREAGIKLSETGLSNRFTGIRSWEEEEIKVINKLFKEKLKVA